jgi:DNA-binding transcriptional MerR regulator
MTSHPQLSEQLLSRSQLAKRFSVCTETIKRWEKRGQLSPIRFNQRVVRYRLSDVVRIEQQAQGGQQ